MQMVRMKEYLDNREFKVEMTYNPRGRTYEFRIIKDGYEVIDNFSCTPSDVDCEELDVRQRDFLEKLIDKWHVSFKKNHVYELKTNNPYGNYDAQLKTYLSLHEEYFEKEKESNTNMDKTMNILRDAARSHVTGMLQINGMRVPVRVTNNIGAEEGKFPRVECAVLAPTRELDEWSAYCHQDWKLTRQIMKRMLNSAYGAHAQYGPQIKDVIFNNPATIVFWKDGTKTVVKAENEEYDPEKGLAMAIAKKTLGNKHDYYNTFKKWLKKALKNNQ